jgi:hypothetical protein
LPVCLFGNRCFFFCFMFGNRFVRDESRSTTEVPLYLSTRMIFAWHIQWSDPDSFFHPGRKQRVSEANFVISRYIIRVTHMFSWLKLFWDTVTIISKFVMRRVVKNAFY